MSEETLTGSQFYKPILDVAAYWNRFKPLTSVDGSKEAKWIRQARLFDELSARNNAAIFLWSTATPNRFVYITDKSKLLGYDASLFTAENGIAFSFSNLHPECLHVGYLMNDKAFNYNIEKQVTPEEQVTIAMESLYKKRDGNYIHFLQLVTLLEVDISGHPLLSLSFLSDISHLKKPHRFNMTIVNGKQMELYQYNADKKCLESIKPLTEQERIVLQFLGRGLTTKEIAKRLFISPNTVDTHRRNLITKTNCVDTTAVVTYARMIGLI